MIKKYLTKKKLIKLIIILPVLVLIVCTPEIKKIYNYKNDIYSKVKNRKFKLYLSNNKNHLSNSCLEKKETINYYNNIYKEIIDVIYILSKSGYIKEQDKDKLFALIKNSSITELDKKVKNLNLTLINIDSLSDYNFLMGLIKELQFFSEKEIEKYYKKSIEINRFNPKYNLQLVKFYKTNCNYDKAINTLLVTSSLYKNGNENKIDLYEIYNMLGNLYSMKRDYENALVYYTNAFINLDYRNENIKKASVLISIGDIMNIRGDYFEAINYYKYALSLNDKKLSKEQLIMLLLKLSDSYYSYGNYENSLKFAKKAAKNSKKINNKLLYSKAKYLECLNYEFIENSDEKKYQNCRLALQSAEEYKLQFNNVDAYINLAEILDYSSYTRNPKLAIKYLNEALDKNNKRNIYNEVYILEKIAAIKAYNTQDKKESLNIYNNLNNNYYNKFNIGIGCCNNLISGFVKEQLNIGNPETDYLSGIDNLKNRKTQLTTLYSYLSDFYKDKKQHKKALSYAKKALHLSEQLYRFDHHYIKYMQERLDSINKEINNIEVSD